MKSKPNIQIQRTNSDILRILSVTLRDKMSNDALRGVSILNVETSADYAFARVFVEIEGSDADKQRSMGELEKSAGFLRNEVASRTSLRNTPQLRFVLDRGRENASRVEELLSQINSESK